MYYGTDEAGSTLGEYQYAALTGNFREAGTGIEIYPTPSGNYRAEIPTANDNDGEWYVQPEGALTRLGTHDYHSYGDPENILPCDTFEPVEGFSGVVTISYVVGGQKTLEDYEDIVSGTVTIQGEAVEEGDKASLTYTRMGAIESVTAGNVLTIEAHEAGSKWNGVHVYLLKAETTNNLVWMNPITTTEAWKQFKDSTDPTWGLLDRNTEGVWFIPQTLEDDLSLIHI